MARNPHMQERLRQTGGDNPNVVRSQLDEARRLSIEQMRQLQRYAHVEHLYRQCLPAYYYCGSDRTSYPSQ